MFGIKDEMKGVKRRVCLKCDRVFNSKGIDNRLCYWCNESNKGHLAVKVNTGKKVTSGRVGGVR